MLIREATPDDVPHMLDIINPAILHTTALYEDQPRRLDEQLDWLKARQQGGWPVLAAVEGAQLLGLASYGVFRDRSAYRHTVEHSVYVAAAARRRGLGRQLVEALVGRARADGLHAMVGGIDAGNAGSIRFHEALGFERAGVLREVGRKFDRWLDLVFMLKLL